MSKKCNYDNKENFVYRTHSYVALRLHFVMIMSFVIGNNLTSVAVGNLLKLLSMMLPTGSRLPRTKYLFDKYFNGFRQGLEYKFFCPSCETLIKTSDSLECTICEEEYERQQLLEKAISFYISQSRNN